MRHQFTTEECRKGGWTRAYQLANARRANPNPLEKEVRGLISSALSFTSVYYEYEFWNDTAGFPQFFDIFVPAFNMAIEIDGSKGWHDHEKMRRYDQAKELFCRQNMITLIRATKKKELEFSII